MAETDIKSRKDLLDIESLSLAEIEYLLKTAGPFKELFRRSVKKVPTLRGKTVLTLFYEPSTRTRTSFEVAANRLSADVTNFAVSTSAVVKGESILDTIETLQAMRTDYIVIRHGASGVPALIAKHTKASVLNAGDGFHAHPTQALLDAFTVREVFPETQKKKILIVGDILHSRVARSTSRIMRKLGMEVGVLGPGSLVPKGRPDFMNAFWNWEDALAWKPDVIYLLRVQMERQEQQFFPSLAEYHRVYGLTSERFKQVEGEGLYLMHPGPVNRGVEIVDEAMTYERCLINQQVENGIATRMAALYWLKPEEDQG
ncbi:MAG: aspartate carbamoyltransferase catalytic subunit [Verrucomicrobiales bacterium]|nr:aspartate carbamoyltransferase catalytic subunit [Verrucomicrobiales bacterium]